VTRKTHVLTSVMLLGAVTAAAACAGEIGHFAPGVFNIRDLAVPPPGFYGLIYNYRYSTDHVNDANGNRLSSVTIGGPGGRSLTVGVDLDVSIYALVPALAWVSHKKVLGAKYGALLAPTFTNASLNGVLSAGVGAGRSASTGQFNVGDIFVQPVWLGWTGTHTDISYGYGFYIPSGKYQINTFTLPVVGPVRAEAADNTGYGFWTNQNQGALYLYPWADKRMAIQNALTWEIHQKKRGFSLTPGQNLTWNWGLSQFLPLKKDHSLLLEAGPTGYSSFQVSDDSGGAVRNPGVHDSVHAVGVQVGVTSVKKVMSFNFRWAHEFAAVDRFQGSSLGLNFSMRFPAD